ncbi:MAG: M23 family metallopeptidase [Prevotella conceptionensis]|uniref:M23 family metallopeptidase n=1 Tax=Prevotella conceptionensis TaxID=340486 RepID=UPI0002F8B20C|nr:M23 family metallopeptidase [Prevotella conceptionensis]
MTNIILSIMLAANVLFGSPVNYPISLAGNFGEPRPNHFHGGVDVKTDGVEGKAIFSIGDGYVSHVSVGYDGFGNAVYVHHPEGYTSVYCHLKTFTPAIKAMVRKWQYVNKQSTGDIWFKPTDLPVVKGQLIAISGNSGASEAPHLHLELHETRSGDMLDPLDFIGHHVKDALAPMAHGFMAYPVSGEGVFNNNPGKSSHSFSSHNLPNKFIAWGKVGFGIWANDYMEITYNRYGVKKTELLVDGKTVFKSNVNRIPYEKTVQVNAWGDHEHFLRYNVWYMHSFLYPGMGLQMLSADKNKGIVNFNQERDYHIEYVLTDFKGNTSRYTFTVAGQKRAFVPQRQASTLRSVYWNRPYAMQTDGVQLLIRPNSVANAITLTPTISCKDDALSNSCTFTNSAQRLFRPARISLKLTKKVKDTSKLYISGRGYVTRYLGGTYEKGWVTANMRDLHLQYSIEYDDEPPIVSPVGQGNWNATKTIKLGLTDAKSGVDTYQGYIDGQFVLFEDVPLSPWVACKLAETPIKRTGKQRRLTFFATDNQGNKRRFETDILY